MSLIQARKQKIWDIHSNHRNLLASFDQVVKHEEALNVMPTAFSARMHYEAIFSAITHQGLNSSPIYYDTNLAVLMPPEQSVLETAFGFSMVLSAQDDNNFYSDGYNSSEASENILILKATESVDCFFDIGANLGYYSFLVAESRQDNVRCYAFEPVLENYQKMQKGIEINGFEQIIFPERSAIGANGATEIEIHLNRYGSGGNSVATFADSRAESNFSERIPLVSLDSYIAKNKISSGNAFVKIDVEGYEEEVITGAQKYLTSNSPPVILIETFPDNGADERVLMRLNEWGYSVWGVRKFVPQSPIIYPAFRRRKLVRSPFGNYIAFHHQHTDILTWCMQPVAENFFLRNRFIINLEGFQQRTFESLKRYAQRLEEKMQGERLNILVAIPEWENLSREAVGAAGIFQGEQSISFWRRYLWNVLVRYPKLSLLKKIWPQCLRGLDEPQNSFPRE